MKALTISRPFALLIVSGEKLVGNRTWWTTWRGLIATHAGKGGQYLLREQLWRYPAGAILSVAVLSNYTAPDLASDQMTLRDIIKKLYKGEATALVGRRDETLPERLVLICRLGVFDAEHPDIVYDGMDETFIVDRFVDVEIREV